MKNVTAISIEQLHQEESTRVWFEVDGEQWAINDNCGELKLVDSDGCPADMSRQDERDLFDLLEPEYHRIAEEYCGEGTEF